MTDRAAKICASCGRTFEWRRRWDRNWDQIRYCSDACRRRKVTAVDVSLETALREALDRPGRSVDPLDTAHEVGGDDWQTLVEPARRAARRLVAQGGFEIVVDGRVTDPSTAKGTIRLRRQ